MRKKKSKRDPYYLEWQQRGYKRSPCITGEPKQGWGAHVSLCMTLLNSPAYLALSGRQRALYVECLAQWGTDPYKDNEYLEQDNLTVIDRRESFFMNLALGKSRKIYKSKDPFYNDLKRLEEVGFIDCIYHGHAKGDKSIYRWSERWKKFPLT